jgi:hypothetical protein
MAQQIINVGLTPNSGTGDPIRTSFQKANANFTELYNQSQGQSVPGVYYVTKAGNDSNSGASLTESFLTIKAATAAAGAYIVLNPGSKVTIFVKTGSYTENNPVLFPAGVTLWGDDLRSVSILPQNATQDIFHLNNACYIAGVTFRGHLSPAAAVAFPTAGAGVITTSPYVQNCSSITTTGCGMRIDGSLAQGSKSMVSDAYTQINEGGIGVHLLNQGYAQLVSIFTVCCSEGILCEDGSTCSVSNSNTSFGTYGLVASGKVSFNNPGLTNGASQIGTQIALKNLAQRPNINQAISFDNGVTLNDIWDVTPLVAGACTVTLAQNVLIPITNNSPCIFFIRSSINASSHTFEYVGTGTTLATAFPAAGAIAIPANQVVTIDGGAVVYTSTDERGDFKVGDQLTINGANGTITGATFDKSLFAVMTPYILALEG